MAKTLRHLLQPYGCVSVCLTQLLPWWQSSPKKTQKEDKLEECLRKTQEKGDGCGGT